VLPRISKADAVRDAGVLLTINSAHDAHTALANAPPLLRPAPSRPISIPQPQGVKAALATQLAGREVPVADVALLSPYRKGLRTSMLVSGDSAERCQGSRFAV
jgi:hypothetical protein